MNHQPPTSQLCPPVNVTHKPTSEVRVQVIKTRASFIGYFQKFVDGREPRVDALPVFYVPCLDRSLVGPAHIGGAMLETGWIEPGADVELWGDVDPHSAVINRCSVTLACNGLTFN